MTPSLVAQPAGPPKTKFTIASDARVSARLVGLGLPLPRLPGPSNCLTRVTPDKADVSRKLPATPGKHPGSSSLLKNERLSGCLGSQRWTARGIDSMHIDPKSSATRAWRQSRSPSPSLSRRALDQTAHSDQVVGRHAQGECPVAQPEPSDLHLAQPSRTFDPAKGMLDCFSPSLADLVTWMSSGPAVDGTASAWVRVLSNVRCEALLSGGGHESPRVIRLVRTYGRSQVARYVGQKLDRGLAFGVAVRFGGLAPDHQSIAVFDHHVAQVTEPSLHPVRFPIEPSLRICGGSMSVVASLLTAEIALA